jgi:hypothetical protein
MSNEAFPVPGDRRRVVMVDMASDVPLSEWQEAAVALRASRVSAEINKLRREHRRLTKRLEKNL